MAWFFVFFFVSGFCSILYELVWLRLAMAQFGVTTALVSTVLSMFMAGLGAGSWIAGAWVRRRGAGVQVPRLYLYALCELLIGVSALAVPLQFRAGHFLLGQLANQTALSSAGYYLVSGVLLALILVPWCACMGATIPLAMFAIRGEIRREVPRLFSFLYLANVLGAVVGAIVPLLLIELYGFRSVLKIGAVLNVTIAAAVFCLHLATRRHAAQPARSPREFGPAREVAGSTRALLLLFATGLATMGMEVIWIRLFTPYVGPVVYSFATILSAYLAATYAGSQLYRLWRTGGDGDRKLMWVSLAVLGLLPLLTADSRISMNLVLRVIVGIAPFAGVIGFLTPMLVDRWSGGDPDRAGRAYAVNVLGCIAGPLLSGFILLPLFGERISMMLFVLPWCAMALPGKSSVARQIPAYGMVCAAFAIFFVARDYETQYPHREVLRDSTATVIAAGEGMNKRLLVNGIGMTALTPITKMMAHLTLASRGRPADDVLVICFGMGTSFRSMLSWNVRTTAVELVPSVPKLFGFFHPDSAQLIGSPLARVIVDDGRRYLERSTHMYDAIIIDPPPPVQAAGSSLLYSEDFYSVAKLRLRNGGILQQWLPDGDSAVQSAVVQALKNSFPYVRGYSSVERWGWHFLASMSPIPEQTAAQLAARMPPAAVADMMEWGPAHTAEEQFDRILSHPVSLDRFIALSPETPALQDDRPVNEYFLLRGLRPVRVEAPGVSPVARR